MLKVFFYLKPGKAAIDKGSLIYARLQYRQQSLAISTGKYISKERWDSTQKLRNVLKLEKEKVLRHSLDTLQLCIEKKFIEMFKKDGHISLMDIKDELKGKKTIQPKEISIIEILETHIKHFKKKVSTAERSKASLQKYERSKELIISFIQKEYYESNIAWNKITSSFVYKLEAFLKYESAFKGKIGIKNNSVVKYIKNNSVVKYMRMYKTACNYALKMELINKNPFNIYDGKIIHKEVMFLTQQELSLIESKKITLERLEKVRDIFIFCCYTGYAPVDASALTNNNLTTDNNNKLWIQTSRAKTAINSNVPVLSQVQKIIDKYNGQQIGLIPPISNQKMNEYLKELAVICKINKKITWYTARHTFATTVTLGNGVRIENVSSMMGHTNILQTQHYAKVFDSNIMEDMEKLDEKMINSKL